MSEPDPHTIEGEPGADADPWALAIADYFPGHHAPQPAPQSDVYPLHCAAVEVCHETVAAEQPDGQLNRSHGGSAARA